MNSLCVTTQVTDDGMLHLPLAELAGQAVKVMIVPLTSEQAPAPPVLIGQAALNAAIAIGFVGGFEADPQLSIDYKNQLDWSAKL
ncbi:hypothetical protein HUU62_23165 [Rhodoferax sp. 4810]|uniref:Uncharacterized protein n=1 Tax=Thiospirillum jenense TaxID=1653858 RepID=A0A839HK75_9GAMM|nr:hypothetical protein [Thiospirillum jenense]MBB1077310.1 hypothetical protein [Rhodoferax jenense]MBB1127077.1 hypothetical protein [Thiospirillum jenense]